MRYEKVTNVVTKRFGIPKTTSRGITRPIG